MIQKIFHQFQRYETARCAIESMRIIPRHKILEVGSGSHGNLGKFIPNDEITYLDNSLSEEALKKDNFILGDATTLDLPEDSYDFVIALDVIEHIPYDKRPAFLASVMPIAKYGVFLTFPHKNDGNMLDDSMLKSTFSVLGSKAPVWIDEHKDCVLPSCEETINALSSYVPSDNIISFYTSKRSLMSTMLNLEAVCSAIPDLRGLFEALNNYYISHVFYCDIVEESDYAAKTCILAIKEGDPQRIRNSLMDCFTKNSHVVEEFENKIKYQLNLMLPFIVKNLSDRKVEEEIRKVEEFKKAEEEKRLAEEEKMKEKAIRLNVLLITYNHSHYINESLQSILMQKTDFPFNIIIADDCSTDDTVAKIRLLEQQADIPFIYMVSDRNLGVLKNYQRAFNVCTAEYIAVMEGDDIWTDPYRLQKHVDFLDNHRECAMSFNRYAVIDYEKCRMHIQPHVAPGDITSYGYLTGHDLAFDNYIGNFSTCVYRKSSISTLPPDFYDKKAYDWLTNIMISRCGFIGFLKDVMSIYRIHEKGVWSGQEEHERIKSTIDTIDDYNEYTQYMFSDSFAAHKYRLELQLITGKKSIRQRVVSVIRRFFRAFITYMPQFIVWIIKALLPEKLYAKLIK